MQNSLWQMRKRGMEELITLSIKSNSNQRTPQSRPQRQWQRIFKVLGLNMHPQNASICSGRSSMPLKARAFERSTLHCHASLKMLLLMN
jgi:hypothetical protein